MLTDIGGSNGTASTNVVRYDSLPFGGELLAGISGRTTGMGYIDPTIANSKWPDPMNPKLTGQLRDNETADLNGKTALDWFNTRYYSGAQGRFQSPDPGNAGADPANPQTWNGYVYVGNNPLSYIDPSGMQGISIGAPAATAAGDSSSLWGTIAPFLGAAIGIGEFAYELFQFYAGGPASHPLPTQPAGQGVTNNGKSENRDRRRFLGSLESPPTLQKDIRTR